MISNIKELKKEITNINKSFSRQELEKGFAPLCKEIWQNEKLFTDFFSMTKYSFQHCTLASRLFDYYGSEVYLRVKMIIPDYCGEIISSWDDFMISQVRRIEQITKQNWYPTKFSTLPKRFIAALHEVCDADLFLEIMTYVSRSWYFQQAIDQLFEIDYPVDYEFVMKRAKSMRINQNCMSRFIHLVKILSDFDFTAAFRAWGQFYYIFEEVYTKSPPISRGFTSSLYNVFFAAPQRKWRILRRYQEEGQRNTLHDKVIISESNNGTLEEGRITFDDIVQQGQIAIDDAIYQYGWDVLHHLFEINADADELSEHITLGQSWIYNRMSAEDQRKADIAIERYKQSMVVPLGENRNNNEKVSRQIIDAMKILLDNTELGLNAWKNTIITASEGEEKITKKLVNDILDKPLQRQMIADYGIGRMALVTHHLAPFIKDHFPQIYLDILNDSWLTCFFYSNCTKYYNACEMATLLLVMGRKEEFHKITALVANNNNFPITVDNFISKVLHGSWVFVNRALNNLCASDELVAYYNKDFDEYKVSEKLAYRYYNWKNFTNITTESVYFDTLCLLLSEYYKERPLEGILIISNFIRRAEENKEHESEWFFERYDVLMKSIGFDPKKHIEEIIACRSLTYPFFSYSKNIDFMVQVLELYTKYKKHEVWYALSSLSNNQFVSEEKKELIFLQFSKHNILY